ncbi:MAG: hypothetical protein KME38_06680 [Spirirestis rafaelensis WJT71-NPBG6]|jgi:hypothetical protein|nr:hypothetical protein [Spirirestis rafaelensis WJT71-NPBG6]
MNVGVIYVATGSKFIAEALNSAASLKEKMPNLDITLFSDESVKAECIDKCIVIKSSQNGYLDKIMGMSQSPYDWTLFLDTDTYICSDFSELFTLPEKYDIGVVLAEHRTGEASGVTWDYQISKDSNDKWLYPIVNSGVILYRKSSKINNFFSDWFVLAKQQMQERGIKHGDQPAFVPTLHKNDLREVILAPEYNCRFVYPVGVCGTVKILHGRHKNLQKIAEEINSDIGPRIFHPRWGLISNRKLKLLKKIFFI